jgi:hypothetical protein
MIFSPSCREQANFSTLNLLSANWPREMISAMVVPSCYQRARPPTHTAARGQRTDPENLGRQLHSPASDPRGRGSWQQQACAARNGAIQTILASLVLAGPNDRAKTEEVEFDSLSLHAQILEKTGQTFVVTRVFYIGAVTWEEARSTSGGSPFSEYRGIRFHLYICHASRDVVRDVAGSEETVLRDHKKCKPQA